MLFKTLGLTVRGIEGVLVEVEVDLALGLPSYQTVGLPDAAVRESRERVVSAVRNSGFEFPARRVTVNLAPADVKKAGSQLDLAISVAVLAASEQLSPAPWTRRAALAAELALDGSLRPVSGVLAMALAARSRGLKAVVVAPANRREAAVVGLAVYSPANLRELAELWGRRDAPPAPPLPEEAAPARAAGPDFREVRGQPFAKRALEISAAGGHNAVLVGPPGTGKSMLAARLASVLPPLSREEAIAVTRVHSVCGLVPPGGGLVWSRPFRAPHHTISSQAMVGGGAFPKPGEVSLAHHGVLFLDELAEFPRDALEALRQPLEGAREVRVARTRESSTFPADFTLIAAMNPCPCGYLGHPRRSCECSPLQVRRYRDKISGPLLDRMDLQVELAPVAFEDWAAGGDGEEPSERIRQRVQKARERQSARLGSGRLNASMSPAELRRYAALGTQERALLEAAAQRLSLSARSLDRVLRVARTAADLAGDAELRKGHLAEALQYRALDRALQPAAF